MLMAVYLTLAVLNIMWFNVCCIIILHNCIAEKFYRHVIVLSDFQRYRFLKIFLLFIRRGSSENVLTVHYIIFVFHLLGYIQMKELITHSFISFILFYSLLFYFRIFCCVEELV